MTKTTENAPAAPTTRELLAEKTLIRQGLLEDVNDWTTLFHSKKQAGLYNSREESHQSEEWLELLRQREELEKVTKEVLELRAKLEKEG